MREHGPKGEESVGGETILGEGGDEGGPDGRCLGRGIEEGETGEVGKMAAGVEGDEMVGEKGDGGNEAGFEEMAVELGALGGCGGGAGGGEGEEKIGEEARCGSGEIERRG